MNTLYKIFILLLPPFLWSFNFVFGRYFRDSFMPIDLAFYRWSLALLVVGILYGKSSLAWLPEMKKNFMLLCVLSILGIALFNTILYYGLEQTTAINSVLIASTTPVMIMVLNLVFFQYNMRPLEFVAMPLSLIGVFFIVSQGKLEFYKEFSVNPGDIIVFFAALSWALYSVWLPKLAKVLPPKPLLTASIFIGWFFLLLGFSVTHFLATHSLASNFFARILPRLSGFPSEPTQFTFASVAFIIYLGIFASVIAYIFWNKAASEIGSNMAGICLNFMPVFAVIASTVLLKEKLHGYHFWGALCIVISLTLIFNKNMKWKKPLTKIT